VRKNFKGERKLLSIGGRVTLLNSIISAVVLYWMSIYRLLVKVKQSIDKLKKNVSFGMGIILLRKKYHLVA
jgi:hypothetical protein